MRAVWLEDRKLRIRDDVSVPGPPDGEVLVRVLKAGICNTDIELTRGYYPYKGILGHEFVGVVDDGPDHLVGRRVVGEINAVCGDCRACREGHPYRFRRFGGDGRFRCGCGRHRQPRRFRPGQERAASPRHTNNEKHIYR